MRTKTPSITLVPPEEGEASRRPLSFRLIRRLMGYTRPYARTRNALLALVVLRAIQLPTLAWVIGAVIAGPIAGLRVPGLLLGALGYAALAALTQYTFRYRSLRALDLGEKVIHDLRRDMFQHLLGQTLSYFHQTKTGRTISRFTNDADAVRVGVQDVLFVSMVGLGQMIVAALFMIRYDAVLFLAVVGLVPVLWGLNLYFRQRLSQAYRAVQESFSRVTATLAESVSGIREIQGFARQDVNASLFEELVSDHARYNVDVARSAGVFVPLLDFNSQVLVAVTLLFGGWRVLHGQAEVGALYQFLLMTGVFFGPIQSLGNQYTQALSAMAGAERVFRFLDSPPAWSEPPDAAALPPLRGRIEFRGVTFGYDPARPVLHDLNFTVEPGRTVALIGHTGSGKSSIVNLIAKFYLPTAGELLVDGRDIRSIDGRSLHAQMGIVLQQNFLFTGTVLDNIRIGKPGSSRAEAEQAVRALDCLGLIASLPEGFLTVVGERGAGLSLGQRQLICFARAMLADPRILILDEATSSVDSLTEARIQSALAALLRGRTSIVVAHRLSTIRHADLVIVLAAGRIVEQGAHRELLLRRGAYAQLYRQFIRASAA